MDDLSIIIFSIVVSVSFISFIGLTVKEFNEMSNTPFQNEKKSKSRKK
jgi:hypothetical protein